MAYTLVTQKQCARLYDGVTEVVRTHLERVAAGLAEKARMLQAEPVAFLRLLCQAYSEHQLTMLMVRDIFLYLDRVYARDGREPLFELGLGLFRDLVVHQPSVQETLRAALLGCVQAERSGDPVDLVLLRNATRILLALGVHSRRVYEHVRSPGGSRVRRGAHLLPHCCLFAQFLERHVLDDARTFYTAEAQRLTSDLDVPCACVAA